MKILHLYYDLMNLYGENGNMRVLSRHLEDQGFAAEVERKTVGETIEFSEYAFIYCGSGTERNQKVALEHLKEHAESFQKAVESGIPCLFTGNSLEMLGSVIHGLDGRDYEGLSLLPFSVQEDKDTRFTGDAVFTADWLGKDFVGFINKCTDLTGLSGETLFTVKMGKGNSANDNREGFRLYNLFATYLTGPMLVKNPHFMQYLIELIGKRDNESFVYREISYPYEEDSYQVALNALLDRIQTK